MVEARLAKLRTIIEGLRAKTPANGCTEAEALLAAAKVAELIDRYDLSRSELEIRTAQCERRIYEDTRNKRVPIGDCIGAIADFCNCRVWREKAAGKSLCFVFFGLPADIDAAYYLTEFIDQTVRAERSRFKISPAYQDFRHAERHLANASFALGMMASIADKLMAMQATRSARTGRNLVVRKAAVVDAELAALGVTLRAANTAPRPIAPDAYEAGEAAGTAASIAGRRAP